MLTADGVEIDARRVCRDAPTVLPTDSPSSLLGEDRNYFDPVWQVQVELSDLERELVKHPALRRLARISHAGAASHLSVQSYSRLEHSLGLLALVSGLKPEDRIMRAAALVHDIGHLPLSHTLETVAGVDHHDLGNDRLRRMSLIFTNHGIDVEDVIVAVQGQGGSRLAGGGLSLDHVESFVRSAHVHGRATEYPRETLSSIWLEQSNVACDEETAIYMKRLALDEAARQTSVANARANAVITMLASRVLAADAVQSPAQLFTMDDRNFWNVLADNPATAEDYAIFVCRPDAWTCIALTSDQELPEGFAEYRIPRLYLNTPAVNGVEAEFSAEERAVVNSLPTRFAVAQHPSP